MPSESSAKYLANDKSHPATAVSLQSRQVAEYLRSTWDSSSCHTSRAFSDDGAEVVTCEDVSKTTQANLAYSCYLGRGIAAHRCQT